MKDLNNHPYYNRPSLQTSFQIASISFLCLVGILLGLAILEYNKKGSNKVNDFDDIYIKELNDSIGDTIIDGEVC